MDYLVGRNQDQLVQRRVARGGYDCRIDINSVDDRISAAQTQFPHLADSLQSISTKVDAGLESGETPELVALLGHSMIDLVLNER